MRPGFYTRKRFCEAAGYAAGWGASMRPGFYTRKSITQAMDALPGVLLQ